MAYVRMNVILCFEVFDDTAGNHFTTGNGVQQ